MKSALLIGGLVCAVIGLLLIILGKVLPKTSWLGQPVAGTIRVDGTRAAIYANIHPVNRAGSIAFSVLLLALILLIGGVAQWWRENHRDADEIF